jgi:hypothetical protein
MTKPPEMIHLKEKIALCKDFTAAERDIILDCMNLADYGDKHEYPARFGPGSSRWATEAWAILDEITPGKLSTTDRFMLGGMIAGALSEMYEAGRKKK